MKKTPANLLACGMVFAVALVIANVVTAKVIATDIPLFGGKLLFPSAVLCYSITFLVTDVVGEIWGRKEARAIVRCGFFCQLLACALVLLAQAMPAADPSMQEAYVKLLGQNAVFVFASLTAYLLSQTWDVFVFHRIRGAVLARHPAGRCHRWIWNNASTMTSQLIDTAVFIGIAFGIGLGWFANPGMRHALLPMMAGQYLVKFVIAALDTPVFYLLTRHAPEEAGASDEETVAGTDGIASRR